MHEFVELSGFDGHGDTCQREHADTIWIQRIGSGIDLARLAASHAAARVSRATLARFR